MEDSPSKPSVAELAGRFKGHIQPSPNDELPYRRKPPCSLKLKNQMDINEDSNKSPLSPNPPKVKHKNSAIIEKLQANLALPPNILLPSPMSPEVKLHPSPLSPTPPMSPLSPLIPLSPTQQQRSHTPSEEEDPVSFETPPESVPLLSINKTRARLSFKRRPPTRQHRKSVGEEAEMSGSDLSQSELSITKKSEVFHSPAQEEEDEPLSGSTGDNEKDRNCENTNGGTPNLHSGHEKEEEEEEEAVDEDKQLSNQVEEEEDVPQDGPREENDRM
ncbi:capZ-interacting protein isoform X2 [Gouania willdenowi]|uniref:capZ-interacting protein isoform X2 n=1 Tax=Gouania willdenowi TaxID=441366 RepID=UPI001056BAA8|nr:capZ-interacting protein isoform X2 [Gouania willdenowi]